MSETRIGAPSASGRAFLWTFERFAGLCAIGAGLGGIAYSLAFVIGLDSDADVWRYAQALLLLSGGLLATAVFVALNDRLRAADPAFSLWALVLGLVGALGSALHGGHDLANLLNPPELATSGPSYVDPRGLGTFALTGLSILVFSLLALRSGLLPRRLAFLGLLAAALLVWVYIGRLVILDPESAGVLPFAVLLGFVVSPAWYVWLGATLLRASQP
ncbi:MAG: hypothetical protein ACRDN6_01840 [Gaiellaceae bacterium]